MRVEIVAAAGPAGPVLRAQPRARGSPRRKTIASPAWVLVLVWRDVVIWFERKGRFAVVEGQTAQS
jgi:hypothetical protein